MANQGGYMGGGGGGGYDSRSGAGGGYPPDRGRPVARAYRAGRAGNGDRDRSRSRDRPPPNDGGGYGGGRGGERGGGRGRGGGGRCRGGGGRETGREAMIQNGLTVQSNYFELKFTADGAQKWFMYKLQIRPSKKTPVCDAKGEVLKDPSTGKTVFEFLVKETRTPLFREDSPTGAGGESGGDEVGRSTPLTRRILQKVQQLFKDANKVFVADGSSIGYAPTRLFEQSQLAPVDVAKKPKTGVYGPADNGTLNEGKHVKTALPFAEYDVNVLLECGEDELEEGQRGAKRGWYKVRFEEVRTVEFSVVNAIIQEANQLESMAQCLNLAVKNALMMSMMAMGPSPRMFYFKPEDQTGEVVGNYISRNCPPTSDCQLFVSLRQAVQLTRSRKPYMMIDLGSDYMRPEHIRGLQGSKSSIPVLKPDENGRGGTLAGVRLKDLAVPVPMHQREQVTEALLKLSFHIKYTCGEGWEKRWLAKGKDADWIKSRRTMNRRNQRMKKPSTSEGVLIKWAANDPVLHSFRPEEKDRDGNVINQGVPQTVAGYFKERYAITLSYPCQPLIRISNQEYFPVEFLYQALGKIRNANSDDQKRHVLGFNDEFAGSRRISHISRLLGKKPLLDDIQQSLQSFKLAVDPTPVVLQANIQPYPVISFDRNNRADINKGSWRLQDSRRDNCVFKKAAKLDSFGIVDFAPGDSSDNIEGLLAVMASHGIGTPKLCSNPSYRRRVIQEHLTVKARGRDPESVHMAFSEAMHKARAFFVGDTSGYFKETKILFQTTAVNPDGQLENVLVSPISGSEGFGLIREKPENACQHQVCNPETGMWHEAQLMYRVKVLPNHTEDYVDLFKVRVSPSPSGQDEKCEAYIQYAWVEVAQLDYIYLVPGEDNGPPLYLQENQVDGARCRLSTDSDFVNIDCVDCPSLVFVLLPDNSADLYNLVKFLAYTKFGVQTQCIVKGRKFADAQTRSNIALKVNAKLFSHLNHAHAWDTAIPWINEVPTLVIGFSMSAAQGQDGKMVVAAAASLDGTRTVQDCRIQSKAPTISDVVISDLVKSLARQFFLYKDIAPDRVLVYRGGGHDGQFQEILTKEVPAMRKAFAELKFSKAGDHTPECNGNGCVFCTPPITFLIAQSQHDVRLVPVGRDSTENVPSGTCVDDAILMSPIGTTLAPSSTPPEGSPMQLFRNADDDRFDFFLIPQGGLKGTSKAVYYRVLWNENYVFKSSSGASQLTKDVLQRVTYHMSFQYSTDAVVTRFLPSTSVDRSRLANIAMGCMSYFFSAQKPMCKPETHDDFTVYIRSDIRPDGTKEMLEGSRRILPAFDSSPKDGKCRMPFHPHLSA